MLKKILFVLLSTWVVSALAYDKPNSVAYYPSEKAYFVSNLAGKTITKLDSNFDKTDIITGLKRPKDILFASFGPYNGLLILDSNEVKVYDADGYSFIASFKVPGAIDLEDAEADKTTPGTFYISDPMAHKIFEVVVGPAPFYTPAFTTLNSTVRNPKALLFDRRNRLLVTTDTIKSQVYNINTINGAATLLNTTSIDNINSIEEDLQGNFYATSWGDSYFYRLDKDFKNAKGLALYSKPTGLFFNIDFDVIVLACSNCNKVEFYKLHMVYINDVDTAKCPGDTFDVNVSMQFKGKGTYNSSNTFYVELSDANGKFSSGILIGSVKSMEEPSYYRVVLPKNKRFYGSNYKIRVRSTSPAFYSLNEMEIVVPMIPLIDIGDKDTFVYCSSNTITLGTANDEDSALVNYLWYLNGKLQTNSKPYMEVINKAGFYKYKLIKQPKTYGCLASDSAFTEEKSGSLSIPFKDTVWACPRQNITIGGDSINETTILWSSSIDSNFKVSTYSFVLPSYRYHPTQIFTATVKSLKYNCETSKNVYLIYKNVPIRKGAPPFYHPGLCTGPYTMPGIIYIGGGDTQKITYQWEPAEYFNNPKLKTPVFTNIKNQNKLVECVVWLYDSITGCPDSLSRKINCLAIPDKPIVQQVSDSAKIINLFPLWYFREAKILNFNGTSRISYFSNKFKIDSFSNAQYLVTTIINQVCQSVADTLLLKHSSSIKNISSSTLSVYPNPANNKIFIKDFKGNIEKAEAMVYNIVGKKVLVQNPSPNGEIDIQNLVPGMYSIRVNFEGQLFNNIFIKH